VAIPLPRIGPCSPSYMRRRAPHTPRTASKWPGIGLRPSSDGAVGLCHKRRVKTHRGLESSSRRE
jgi:hypothetical protein